MVALMLAIIAQPVFAQQETHSIPDDFPYPVHVAPGSNCNFKPRELQLIQDTLIELPEAYQSIPVKFRFEKKCELNTRSQSSKHIRVAYSTPQRIVLLDRAFEIIKDGQLLNLNSRFSKMIIAHELSHILDWIHGYSKSKSFRKINRWARNWTGRLRPASKNVEGFYRSQGKQNPKENFATAAEGYFFDPEFICEQPATYAWFSTHIGPSLVERIACPELNSPIDPEKIRAVGYLWISATDDKIESRFGHAMLHFHDSDKDPFNDILIQAAANLPGQPIYSGYENQQQLAEMQKDLIQISRLGFLFKGATAGLDLVVQPLKYKAKWLETVVIQGRDMREKILNLDREQLRAMIYMVNRDIHNRLGPYRFFKKNCATYVGETLNKAFATELIHPNKFGVYTPNRVYSDLSSEFSKELPVLEGDRTRLARLLPKRQQLLTQLMEDDRFASISLKTLWEPAEKSETAAQAAETLSALIEHCKFLADKGQLTQEVRKSILTIIYTFTLEQNLKLKADALNYYKAAARIPIQ